MQSIIAKLGSNPILIVIFAILIVFLTISIIKRLIKLLIPILILILIYFGYLYYTGQEIPDSAEKLLKSGRENIEKLTK